MTMIDTFEGIEDGTDVAVLTSTGTMRWRLVDGQLRSQDGSVLDPWFFTGYLNEGKVMLGNFAPPAVGEWFAQYGREIGHLVVKADSNQTTAYCARYLNGRFRDFVTLHHVVDQYQRLDRPAWITQQYVDLAVLAYGWQESERQSRERNRVVQNSLAQVRYARDYLNTALEAMNR